MMLKSYMKTLELVNGSASLILIINNKTVNNSKYPLIRIKIGILWILSKKNVLTFSIISKCVQRALTRSACMKTEISLIHLGKTEDDHFILISYLMTNHHPHFPTTIFSSFFTFQVKTLVSKASH